MESDRQQLSQDATELLAGKTIQRVELTRPIELLVECRDGTRLYVNAGESTLELSITESRDRDA